MVRIALATSAYNRMRACACVCARRCVQVVNGTCDRDTFVSARCQYAFITYTQPVRYDT